MKISRRQDGQDFMTRTIAIENTVHQTLELFYRLSRAANLITTMKSKTFAIILVLLSTALGAAAQNRIKKIDITVELPKVGADAMEELQVTSIITDAFGSQNMLGDEKITGAVQAVKFDDYGNPCLLEVQDVYESGRKYKLIVRTTNYTDILYNYKNDKNFTVDNTMVKAYINGQKANITLGSGRPLTCEVTITMPGERDPLTTNTAVSPADGQLGGYGYIDLGLPSGALWATCNVGAAKPETLGNKYGYGETKPKNKITKENFTGYGAYTLGNQFNIKRFDEEDNMYSVESKLGRRLKPEYDAARQNMGGKWSTPTRDLCGELRENCYVKHIKYNGVNGTLYTSKKNGKSLFIPYEQYSEKKRRRRNIYDNQLVPCKRHIFLYMGKQFLQKRHGRLMDVHQ